MSAQAPPIARFGPEAAALLADMHRQCFAEAWSVAAIGELLRAPASAALVAGAPTPVGFAIARRAADEAELLTLGVLPAARRQGIGRALIEALAGWAREKGAQRLFLEVGSDDAAALALYRCAGFATVGRRRDYYGAGSDALIMQRDVCHAAF